MNTTASDYAERVVKVDEIVNPYLIYEMAIGGGCTEQEAKAEMMLYCKEVGVTNSHVQGLSAL